MDEELSDPVGYQQQLLVMVQALAEIVNTSSDPETIRIALSALTNTDAGMSHLRVNPIQV